MVHELAPYGGEEEGRAHIAGPSLLVTADTAQALAVSLHELATNAAKYGALSVPEGIVRIEWSRLPEGSLKLCWTEAGGPMAKPPKKLGFGMRVMQGMIAAQAGTIEFVWNPQGLVCDISIAI